MIGLTYFLPLDVSFSLWFFYLFSKFENVTAVAMGYHDPGASQAMARIPYIGEQSAGAFIGVAIFALWGMRNQLKEAIRNAFSRRGGLQNDDANEPMSYRMALFGGAGGFLLLVGFGMAIGMSWACPGDFLSVLLPLCHHVHPNKSRSRPALGIWAGHECP